MTHITLWHFVSLSFLLFCIGAAGLCLNRRHIIVILMSLEIILLAVNLLLVAVARQTGEVMGEVFALVVLAVAAAEAAIGLALLVVIYRRFGCISLDNLGKLRG